MNLWLSASLVLVFGLIPCVWIAARSDLGSGLAALSVAGVIAVVMLMTLTVALARPPFIQIALVLAPLEVIGTLAFVRFMERRR